MSGVALDIRAERESGPEVRRTLGGLPYRVSRTHTPDLEEIRRELDRKREAAATAHSPNPPQHAPSERPDAKTALDGFAWIHQGLGMSIAGNKILAPSNKARATTATAKPGRGSSAAHARTVAEKSSSRRPEGGSEQRPQTARQLTSQSGQHGTAWKRDDGAMATPQRPQTGRPGMRASPNLSARSSKEHEDDMGRATRDLPDTLVIDVSDDSCTGDQRRLLAQQQLKDVGGYMGQKSVMRSRRVGEAPPPPPPEVPRELLRDPMATLEGRWAGAIQERIETISAQAAKKTSYAVDKMQGDGLKCLTADKPIIAAAANGAILPFSTHPVVTDPLHSVWKHKKAALDPHKTSAGLTQDLINWSKFDNRYDKPRPPAAKGTAGTASTVKEDVLAAEAEEDMVQLRNQEEWATAMQRVQQELKKERKSDTARFHAMVRHGWTLAHRQYEDALHLVRSRVSSVLKK